MSTTLKTATLAIAGFTSVGLSVAFVQEQDVLALSVSGQQSTVTSDTHPNGGFLLLRVKANADKRRVAAAAAKLPQILAAHHEEPEEEGDLPNVMAGVGFSTNFWEELVNSSRRLKLPNNFSHHVERKTEHGVIPHNEGREIMVHVKAENVSLCYEIIDEFVSGFNPKDLESVEHKQGFQYQNNRDLSGHLDGTENVQGDDERNEAALASEKGGSYIIHQKWVHDIAAMRKMSLKESEKMVGRSKADSVEFSVKKRSPNSHVSRMRDANDNKIPIVRQSMPFGHVGAESGLLFIAYSSSPKKFDQQLDQMVGLDNKKGHHDMFMHVSKCARSNYFYVPTLEELRSLE